MIDNIITGVVAQAFAGIAYTPVDVVKERMQVSSVLPTNLKTNNGVDYRNAFDALKTIVKNEGIKNGLMRGYWAQNFVWWPWSACYFVAYEKGLEIFRRNNNDNKSNNVQNHTETYWMSQTGRARPITRHFSLYWYATCLALWYIPQAILNVRRPFLE